jgi:hypothetical protein
MAASRSLQHGGRHTVAVELAVQVWCLTSRNAIRNTDGIDRRSKN